MKTFKEFYKENTGIEYPGVPGEYWHEIHLRVLEQMADYFDYILTNRGL